MKVGDKFYYTGNMANRSCKGEVIGEKGNDFIVKYENGTELEKRLPKCLVTAPTEKNIGNANQWFELEAYRAIREEQLKKFGGY